MQTHLSVAEPTARRALQLATRETHERLHDNIAFARLLRGDMTRAAYRRLLAGLLGLHDPIETALERLAGDPLLAWRSPGRALSRGGLLRDDLQALGLDPREIAAAPRADSLLPLLTDAPSALGCAWVVEGSALGGRVMAAKVGAIADLPPNGGGRAFFASDTGQPARWRGCCDAVETCGLQPEGLATMICSAMATFAAFQLWLDANG